MSLEHNPVRRGRLIRIPEMMERLGVARVTLWRMTRRGELPQPVHPTPAITAWFESDLDKLFEQLQAGREAQ